MENGSSKKSNAPEPSSSRLLSFLHEPQFCIRMDYKVTTDFNNENTVFNMQPQLFEPVKSRPFLHCIPRKDRLDPFAQILIKDYGIVPEDCNRVGINLELAFKQYLKETERSVIGSLHFFVISLTRPEDEEKQQQEMDIGIPEGIYTKFLSVYATPHRNPRVHERLNYDNLLFIQPWAHDSYEVNEKMLNCQLLALQTVITNAEVLKNFQGWGMLVDFAEKSGIKNSFITDRINEWVEGNSSKRRLTGLFDRNKKCDHKGGCECHGHIMSMEETILLKERIGKCCDVNVLESKPFHTSIRLIRKDKKEADLIIFHDNGEIQDCRGIAFVQPPDQEISYFLFSSQYWCYL